MQFIATYTAPDKTLRYYTLYADTINEATRAAKKITPKGYRLLTLISHTKK